jgi:fructose-1,6-bisphosphatase
MRTEHFFNIMYAGYHNCKEVQLNQAGKKNPELSELMIYNKQEGEYSDICPVYYYPGRRLCRVRGV